MSNPKLSIIIPAYNESENLKKGVLNEVSDYLSEQKYPYEVLIVDDGSSDDTVLLTKEFIADKKFFNIIENPHGGKAFTVITGLLKSRGDIALFTDMDQATPISEVEKFFPKFKKGYDIVIGSRHGRKGAPLLRKMMAWGFATFRNLILGLPFSDTQCGFKAFNKSSREEIFKRMLNNWNKTKIVNGTAFPRKVKGAAVNAGFDVETLFLAKKLGFKIREVPVEWHHVGTERVQLIKDSFDAIRDVFRIKLNDLKRKYY
jgi:dolichyl-phosphate beta-glucosyltransferase